MAEQRSYSSRASTAPPTLNQGIPNREGVCPEGIPAATESRPSASAEIQGSSPNGRVPSGCGDGKTQAESPKGDSGLPASLQPIPAPEGDNPFLLTQGVGVLQTIADRFNDAREHNKVGAWRQFQKDLMSASPFLVPHLIPYKDLISIVADIEKEIKGSNVQAGKSNEELMAEFLNGGSELKVTAPVPAEPASSDT